MNKELIERIAKETANTMREFVWKEGCSYESGVLESEVVEFATRFLARIDAERGKDAVAEVGDGWEKSDVIWLTEPPPDGTKLFLSPTIPEGMVLVPASALDGILMWLQGALDCKEFEWSPDQHDCASECVQEMRKHMLAAAQGERE